MANNAPVRGSAVATAAGDCVIPFVVRGLATWDWTQFSAEMANPGTGTCSLRLNGALVCPFNNPARAAVDGPPYVTAGVGDVVTVEWKGVPAGQVGQAIGFWQAR